MQFDSVGHNVFMRWKMICDCKAALRSSLSSRLLKVTEAELLYKQCVSDAKIHQDELVRVKERIISHIRKLICQGDTVLKEVGIKSKLNAFWNIFLILWGHSCSLQLHVLCTMICGSSVVDTSLITSRHDCYQQNHDCLMGGSFLSACS